MLPLVSWSTNLSQYYIYEDLKSVNIDKGISLTIKKILKKKCR